MILMIGLRPWVDLWIWVGIWVWIWAYDLVVWLGWDYVKHPSVCCLVGLLYFYEMIISLLCSNFFLILAIAVYYLTGQWTVYGRIHKIRCYIMLDLLGNRMGIKWGQHRSSMKIFERLISNSGDVMELRWPQNSAEAGLSLIALSRPNALILGFLLDSKGTRGCRYLTSCVATILSLTHEFQLKPCIYFRANLENNLNP